MYSIINSNKEMRLIVNPCLDYKDVIDGLCQKIEDSNLPLTIDLNKCITFNEELIGVVLLAKDILTNKNKSIRIVGNEDVVKYLESIWE